MLMGFRQYARHRKVHLGTVQKAIASGRIVCNENKKIDSELADRMWEANTDISRQSLDREPVKAREPINSSGPVGDLFTHAGQEEDESIATDPASEQDTLKYKSSRATREQYNSLMAEIEYLEKKKLLIDRKWAEMAAFTALRALRDAVLNVPARICNHLAVMSESEACESLLENELTQALASVDMRKLFAEDEESG